MAWQELQEAGETWEKVHTSVVQSRKLQENPEKTKFEINSQR